MKRIVVLGAGESGTGAAILAKRKGMERVLLNTYSFQAPGFYRAMGYDELLCIDPCFGKYSQHFFSKMLS